VAALALAQWPRGRGYVNRDRELAALYSEAVAGCEWLTPQEVPPENDSSWHIWSAVFSGDEHGIEYDHFVQALRENGADYFLPSFMPYGAFGLDPSPAYRYPLFSEPRASDQGRLVFREGLCPSAERLVPRLFNTVLSPVEDSRVLQYADGLRKTIDAFS
jgi:dTDP-4-amino-4,6-dideoxygalactose transaminase